MVMTDLINHSILFTFQKQLIGQEFRTQRTQNKFELLTKLKKRYMHLKQIIIKDSRKYK